MNHVMSEMDACSVATIDGPAGTDLAWKFFSLGNLAGKTATEIIAGVGMPTFKSSVGNGLVLLQWEAMGFAMALLFNAEGRAVRITHECTQVAV